MGEIEQLLDRHSLEISKLKSKDKFGKNIINGELRDIRRLKEELSDCLYLESTENLSSLDQAMSIRCIQDMYCQWQNLYYKVNSVPLHVRKEVEGTL